MLAESIIRDWIKTEDRMVVSSRQSLELENITIEDQIRIARNIEEALIIKRVLVAVLNEE